MSDDTIRRQDAGRSLGIFRDGRLIEVAPDDLDAAYALRDRLATRHGVPRDEYEVLKQCPDHPDASAVDCLDCEPVE
jgi:hypothetical protein